jgi:ParB-like chromosome segregation protein Spo0J
MGDKDALAESIAEVGLLHPIVVRTDNTLIAGERRLEACKALGWSTIPATMIDIALIARGELAENTSRLNFCPSESVAIGIEVEGYERAEAQARQAATQGNKQTGVGKFSEPAKGRALDKVAGYAGMSRPTYARAKAVVQAAEQKPEK